MSLFAKQGYTKDKLFTLNVCRMHLHAVTLSNIVTADGIFVTSQAWTGYRNNSRLSPYKWPRTHRPPNAAWQVWQQAITNNILIAHHQHLRLQLAIGTWTDDQSFWNWFSTLDRTILYHREGGLWRAFSP
jgi:hypothetical protein